MDARVLSLAFWFIIVTTRRRCNFEFQCFFKVEKIKKPSVICIRLSNYLCLDQLETISFYFK